MRHISICASYPPLLAGKPHVNFQHADGFDMALHEPRQSARPQAKDNRQALCTSMPPTFSSHIRLRAR
jgi:hypothetical protein